MSKIILIPLVAIVLLLIDLYVFQAVKIVVQNLSPSGKNIIFGIFWGFSTITLLGFFLYHFTNPDLFSKVARQFMLVLVFINYISKTIALLVLFIGDVIRFGQWSFYKISDLFNNSTSSSEGEKISRSEFFAKSALIAGSLPLAAMSFGIISGAHDYRIRRKSIVIPNLPKAWHGVTIAQVSDIHSGSFWNKVAVEGGVDMLLAEKPDLIFFTGDLVNNEANEVENYIPIFSKLKADLGVYSILGNHDYGDYKNWPSEKAKQQNLQNVIDAHGAMGWDILLDEHRVLEVDKEPLAILGVENWGAGRFAKYGDIAKAYQGTEDFPAKILLSHDPSHWDAQIRKDYQDIDLMLAGHTHGFQFGVEIPGFKWSPSQYVYKQWAGLYQEGNQNLYVNRGYGYLGYPGRIGIPPEITILELRNG